MKKSIVSSSFLQTKNIAKTLAEIVLGERQRRGATVIALVGELGSGKTTFAQGFAKGLGIKARILSPTFILLKEFAIQHSFFRVFYHIDCYRLKDEKDLEVVGIREIMLNPENIVAIEWPEKIKKIMPKNATLIKFKHSEENKREILF